MARLRIAAVALIFVIGLGHARAVHGEPILTLENVANFVLSPQRDLIAIISTDGSAYLWSTRENRKIVDLAGAQFSYGGNLVWSPDERYVAASQKSSVHLWEVATGQLIGSFNGHPDSLISDIFVNDDAASHGAHSIAFSSDGILLATANELDSTVILHSVPDGDIVGLLQVSDPTLGVYSLISGSDDLLVIGTLASVEVWNTRSQQRLYRFDNGDFIPPALSPDNSKLAIGDGRMTSAVKIYDLATGELIWTFHAPLTAFDLQWTPDSRILVGNFTDAYVPSLWIYVGFSIRSWNTDYGLPLNIFNVQSEQIVDVDLKADEMLIGLSNGEYTNQVFVWNQGTGDAYHVRTSPETSRIYRFSTEPAYGIALNGDGSILAADIGNEIVLWNFLSGQEIARIPVNRRLGKIDFLSDNQIIAFGDYQLSFEALNHG